MNCLIHLQMWTYTHLSRFPFLAWRCGPGGCKSPLGNHLINFHRMDREKTHPHAWQGAFQAQLPSSFWSPLQVCTKWNNKVSFYIKKKTPKNKNQKPFGGDSFSYSLIYFYLSSGKKKYSNLKNCRRLFTISWTEFFIASRMNSKHLAVAFREFITFPKIYFQLLFPLHIFLKLLWLSNIKLLDFLQIQHVFQSVSHFIM